MKVGELIITGRGERCRAARRGGKEPHIARRRGPKTPCPERCDTMTRHWHLTFERIARWLKPSAANFAAAAAAYVPDLMLQLEATRRRGAVPAPPSCHEVHFVTAPEAPSVRSPSGVISRS